MANVDDLVIRAAIRDELSGPLKDIRGELGQVRQELEQTGDEATRTARKTDQVDQSFKRSTKSGSGLAKMAGVGLKAGLLAVGTAAITAGALTVKFAADSIRAASDLNETVNKSNVIFGKNAKSMEKWAAGAATSAGLSKQAALEAAAGFGDMFSQIGFGQGQAATMSKDVVQLAADLGSFNNLQTGEVTDMISAAFRGEYDSLQRVIPNINAARVESEALAKTGKKTAKELTAQEKAAATLAIIHKDGARAAGDFARTSGGLANQQKILAAKFDNLKGTVGQKLLPVAVKLVSWAVDDLIPAMGEAWEWIDGKLIPTFRRFGDSLDVKKITGVVASIKETFIDAWTILTALWERFGPTLTKFIKSAFSGIVKIVSGAWKIISGIFKVFASLLTGDWKGVWEGIKRIVSGAWGIIKGIVQLGWAAIRGIFGLAWNALKGTVVGIWHGIESLFSAGVDKLISVVRGIPGTLRNLGGIFKDAGAWLIEKLLAGLSAAGGFAANLGSKIWSVVRGLINGGISWLNRQIDKVIPGNVPDIPGIPAGDTHTRRGSGRGNLGRTLGHHAAINAALGGRYAISNALTGGGGRGRGSGDHQAGRALDVTGRNLSAYAREVRRRGGYAAIHGSGGGKHVHAVMGDTPTSRSGRMFGPGGSHVTIQSGAIVIHAGSASAAEIRDLVEQLLREIARDAEEMADA